MFSPKTILILTAILLLAFFCYLQIGPPQGGLAPNIEASDPEEVAATTMPRQLLDEPKLEANALEAGKVADDSLSEKIPSGYGVAPDVNKSATPQTEALFRIVEKGEGLERLSVLTGGQDVFDGDKYFSDAKYRKDYLVTPDFGRVFAPAQPGPGVPRIRRASPRFVPVLQGESASLKVSAPAGSPVSFTSFDLGRFRESQLTTITVEADEQGVAEATFEATPGTISDVNIMAAGPTTSGQVRFVVNISLPEEQEP